MTTIYLLGVTVAFFFFFYVFRKVEEFSRVPNNMWTLLCLVAGILWPLFVPMLIFDFITGWISEN